MSNRRFEVDQGFKLGGLVIDEATGDITTTGNIQLTGSGTMLFPENAKLAITQGGTGSATRQAAINTLTGTQTSGYYLRSNGTDATMSPLSASDLSGAVAIIKGGTGQTSQQAAINALVGTQTSGYYLRSDGTNVTMSSLTASDLVGNVAIANGGTGQTTATAAFNALAPTQTGNTGKFLTTNGTNTSWANVVTSSSADTLTNKTLSSPEVNSPVVKGERAVMASLGTLSTGTTTVDLTQAQIFTATIAASATVTFSFTNPPGANLGQMVMLRLTNAGDGTINWPAGTKFSNGQAPVYTTAGVDLLGVFYDPASTSYVVFVLGKDIK